MDFARSSIIFLFTLKFGCLADPLPTRAAHPQIVAHRGASGYVPEHSLQGYQLAIDLKADYIEPDLCLSKDGVFVALHDLWLDDTTNVADLPQFADRYTTKVVDGKNESGYFVSDFLYSELLELRLKQRTEDRTKIYDGYFQMPSFDQIMQLAQSTYTKTGRMVGIMPELKRPTYFNSIGFHMEDMFLDSLQKGGYIVTGSDVPNDIKHSVVPVVVQCFYAESLQYLRTKSTLPLLQLYGAPYLPVKVWNEESLQQVATYANALGPPKTWFGTISLERATNILNMASQLNLVVFPWTFRADLDYTPRFGRDFAMEEMYYYCCLSIDGGFTEFPDRTRETLDMLQNYTSNAAMPLEKKCPIDCHRISIIQETI